MSSCKSVLCHALPTYARTVQASLSLCRALYVLDRHDEIQVGLTAEEKQQLQEVTFEQLLTMLKAASFSFSTGASAYRGVCYRKQYHKYRAQICIAGKKKELGMFQLEEDAAEAYDKAAITVFGR